MLHGRRDERGDERREEKEGGEGKNGSHTQTEALLFLAHTLTRSGLIWPFRGVLPAGANLSQDTATQQQRITQMLTSEGPALCQRPP